KILNIVPGKSLRHGPEFVLLRIDIVRLKEVNALYGRKVGNEALRLVVEKTRAVLRPLDTLFRCDSDEFMALLYAADLHIAGVIAERISDNVARHPLSLRSGETIRIEVTVTVTPAPRDRTSIREILADSRRGESVPRSRRSTPSVH